MQNLEPPKAALNHSLIIVVQNLNQPEGVSLLTYSDLHRIPSTSSSFPRCPCPTRSSSWKRSAGFRACSTPRVFRSGLVGVSTPGVVQEGIPKITSGSDLRRSRSQRFFVGTTIQLNLQLLQLYFVNPLSFSCPGKALNQPRLHGGVVSPTT